MSTETVTRHTPGPWTVELELGLPVVRAHEGLLTVASVMVAGGIGGLRGPKADEIRSEVAANASLIAAAPDLLSAVKTARLTLEVACGKEAPYIKQAYTVIDQAIAKAEGGAQ